MELVALGATYWMHFQEFTKTAIDKYALQIDTIGMKPIYLVMSSLVLVPVCIKLIRFIKLYRFYASLPGSSDRSLLFGHLRMWPPVGEERLNFGKARMQGGQARYYCFWAGPFHPNVVAMHPTIAKTVFQASTAIKARALGTGYKIAIPYIGEGLFVANGHTWARSRKLLNPAFNLGVLKTYLQVYNDSATRLFEKLDKLAETGESFDMCPLATLYTLEVILKCTLGCDIDVQGKGHHYVTAVKELLPLMCERTTKPLLWFDFTYKLTKDGKRFFNHCDYVHKFAEEIIEKRKRELESGKTSNDGKKMDFIDMLLTARDEEGKSMTSQEIRNEVDTLMFAGHDSTGTAIPWLLYNLILNPDYMDRVREEVDGVLGSRENKDVTWQDLNSFEMLTQCTKESLRLFPNLPYVQRELTADLDFDGTIMPAGTTVTLPIVHLQRNPQVWDEPDEFRPERFGPENKGSFDNSGYVPFGAGERLCIGNNFALNEIRTVVSRLLHRYNVKFSPDHKLPNRLPIIILKADTGIWLTLEKRQ